YDHVYHYFAGSANAQLYISQKASVMTHIIKREIMFAGIIPNELPHLVGRFGLQVTMRNINYFIEEPFGVETGSSIYCRNRFGKVRHIVLAFTPLKLRFGDVAIGAKCILQVISIVTILLGSNNRKYFG